MQSGGPKSSVDDLCTGRGVVLGRAATTLRSIETQPFDWMICLVSWTSHPPIEAVCVCVFFFRWLLASNRGEGSSKTDLLCLASFPPFLLSSWLQVLLWDTSTLARAHTRGRKLETRQDLLDLALSRFLPLILLSVWLQVLLQTFEKCSFFLIYLAPGPSLMLFSRLWLVTFYFQYI